MPSSMDTAVTAVGAVVGVGAAFRCAIDAAVSVANDVVVVIVVVVNAAAEIDP